MGSEDEIFGVAANLSHSNEQLSALDFYLIFGVALENTFDYQSDSLENEVKLPSFWLAAEELGLGNSPGGHYYRFESIAQVFRVSHDICQGGQQQKKCCLNCRDEHITWF